MFAIKLSAQKRKVFVKTLISNADIILPLHNFRSLLIKLSFFTIII